MKIFPVAHPSKAFNRWLISYLFVLTVPIMVISFIYYISTSGLMRTYNTTNIQRKVEASAEETDKLLGSIKHVGVMISFAPWTTKLSATIDRIQDYFTIRDATRELGNYVALNPAIENLSVIFPNNNSVISKYGLSSYDFFFEKDSKFPAKVTGQILDEITKNNYFKFLDSTVVTSYQKSQAVIPIIQTLDFSTQTPQVALLTLAKKEAILGMLKKGFEMEPDVQTAVLFDNGMLYSEKGTEPVKEKGWKSMPAKGAGISSFINKKDLIYMVDSEYANWQYVFVIPDVWLSSNIRQATLYIFFLSLGLFVAGLAASILMSRRNYKPLKRLYNEVVKDRSPQDVKKVDEFEVIQNSVESLERQRSMTERQLNEYEPIVKNSKVQQMLKGSFSDNEADYRFLEEIGLESGINDSYAVVIAEILREDADSPGDRYRTDGAISAERVKNLIAGILKDQHIKAYVFRTEPEVVVAILSFSGSSPEYGENISGMVSTLKKYLGAIDGDNVYIGAGEVCSGFLGISKSYLKAENMLKWVIFTGDDSIIGLENFHESEQLFYFYPTDWEVQIANNLRNGNLDTVMHILNEIKLENYVKRTLSFEVLRRLIVEIIETGMRVIGELNIMGLKQLEEYKKALNSRTDSEMWLFIEKMYGKICEHVKSMQSNRKSMYSEQLVEYINKNFESSDISLKSLSEKFGIPVPMVSKIFKEITGVNFLDYINRKRVQRAKELLKDTSKEIYVISNMLGYDNDITFRRIFKKYEGINPTVYRTLNSK